MTLPEHPILTPIEALRELLNAADGPTSDNIFEAIHHANLTLAHYNQVQNNQWPPGAIRDLRHSLNMTQAEFAAALGDVSPTSVHNWEIGLHKPSRKTLAKLDAFVQRQEQPTP